MPASSTSSSAAERILLVIGLLACALLACKATQPKARGPSTQALPMLWMMPASADAGPADDGGAAGEQDAGTAEPEPALVTHCTEGETTIFACVLDSGQLVSVCALPPAGAAGAQVQVFLGPPGGAPSLAFPPAGQGAEGLVLDRYARPQVTQVSLSFVLDGRRYDVFDEVQQGKAARGVRLTQGAQASRRTQTWECTEPVAGTLLELEDLSDPGF